MAGTALLLSLVLCSGCRRPSAAVQRLAIGPIENLSGDASLDATARALPSLLKMRLRGLPDLDPAVRPDPSGRPTMILRGYFYRQGQMLRLRAFLTQPDNGATLRLLAASGPVEDAAIAMAGHLSSQISGKTRPWPTRIPQALRSYARAAAATSLDERQRALEDSLQADPAFGDACLDLTDLHRLRQDMAAAERTAQTCMGGAIDPLSRARLELSLAFLRPGQSGAPAQRLKLARLMPADSELAATVAEDFLRARRFPDAVQWYRRAVTADPRWPQAWNLLAYAQCYAGDFDDALQSVERYRSLERFSINPDDSKAEILFAAGRFAEAESLFLDIYRRDPDFGRGAPLRKAAQARLLMGDPDRAREHFQRYLDAAGFPEPLRKLSLAQWQYVTGSRLRALEELAELIASSREQDFISRAWSQSGIWQLDLGRDAMARESCRKAAATASSGPSRRLAGLCAFLAGGMESGDWAVNAERNFTTPEEASLKQFAIGYGLLLSRQFSKAALVWKEVLAQTHPTVSDEPRLLLAWALAASGKEAEAALLLKEFALPRGGLESSFECFLFPREIYLHARALERGGQRKQAQELYRLYLRYAGELDTRFGEAAAARKALAGS